MIQDGQTIFVERSFAIDDHSFFRTQNGPTHQQCNSLICAAMYLVMENGDDPMDWEFVINRRGPYNFVHARRRQQHQAS